ncbi:tetratricopeptide repeat protein [Paenibacillus albiflavus]|nr:tetratricopeptide repeat protein [Paenibacillus albiflavus]
MDSEQMVQKAYACLLSHDFANAEKWFELAIEGDPENASLHYKLSVTYARNNKLQKALWHAKLAVQYNTEEQLYLAHLQHLEARRLIVQAEGYFDGTTESLYMVIYLLRHAVNLDPLAIQGYLLLGEAYAGLEDYDQAIKFVKEAIKLDPLDDYAILELERYKLKLEQYLKQ